VIGMPIVKEQICPSFLIGFYPPYGIAKDAIICLKRQVLAAELIE
jgi:hypothetical protein